MLVQECSLEVLRVQQKALDAVTATMQQWKTHCAILHRIGDGSHNQGSTTVCIGACVHNHTQKAWEGSPNKMADTHQLPSPSEAGHLDAAIIYYNLDAQEPPQKDSFKTRRSQN